MSSEGCERPRDKTHPDLHRGLLRNLGRFIAEPGRDFCMVGSEYPVQVGKQDFAIDLVLFTAACAAWSPWSSRLASSAPKFSGQLSFYLEALDRYVKKPHERPLIGVLFCATKDAEVVEYSLSRTLSLVLVTEH